MSDNITEAMEAVDRNLPRVIRQAMADRAMLRGQLASIVGMEPKTLSSKLQGRTQFKASEITGIAHALGTPEGELYRAAAQLGVDDGAQLWLRLPGYPEDSATRV